MQIPRNATMMMMQSKNISSDRKINLRDAITKIFPNAWQQTSEYYVACTETQHSMRDETVEGGRRRRERLNSNQQKSIVLKHEEQHAGDGWTFKPSSNNDRTGFHCYSRSPFDREISFAWTPSTSEISSFRLSYLLLIQSPRKKSFLKKRKQEEIQFRERRRESA